MKALSLWNPWAALVAIGAKRVETRGWAPSYRGELAIHATVRFLPAHRDLCFAEPFRAALEGAGYDPPDALPTGAVVAVCRLVDCFPTREATPERLSELGVTTPYRELLFGDYTAGRWAWLLADVRPFPAPIPAKGGQQLWNWSQHADAAPGGVSDCLAGLEGLRRIVGCIDEDTRGRRAERAAFWRTEAGRMIDAIERSLAGGAG